MRSFNIKALYMALAVFSLSIPTALGKNASDAYTEYIATYSEMAIEHQNEYGIPASITLAQGLLESAAGRSTLATHGNNHFGIKCHNDWEGDTMLRDDDAPDECFRVYVTPAESFRDHSQFLRRKRYEPLFQLDITDYAAWAKTLRKCGYATDPHYANRLIAIIERYSLYRYDTEGGRRVEENVDFIMDNLRNSHPIRRNEGLAYVIAAPGDTYKSIAEELGLDAERLAAINDSKANAEIKAWEEVYLVEKRDEGISDKFAVIGEDESIHSIAQRYGLKLQSLLAMNPKAKDRPGTKLRLRRG